MQNRLKRLRFINFHVLRDCVGLRMQHYLVHTKINMHLLILLEYRFVKEQQTIQRKEIFTTKCLKIFFQISILDFFIDWMSTLRLMISKNNTIFIITLYLQKFRLLYWKNSTYIIFRMLTTYENDSIQIQRVFLLNYFVNYICIFIRNI